MGAEEALALGLEGVRRSFPMGLGLRRRAVLHGIDLDLERGRTLGVVGPNGSGKSTLMRIVAGIDRPSAGRVAVLGGSPADARVRARLAFLPEDSPFPRELSALSMMDLLGGLHGMRRRQVRPRAQALLERVGLASTARAPLRTYSRGMLRRFGLAQAFLADPELVLLDEPTAGLDAPGFAVLEDLLGEAQRRGASVLLTSHLLSDVHDHCDGLAILIDGRIAGRGAPGELLTAEGRVQVEVEGLDPAALGKLEAWVGAAGGRVLRTRPGGRTLLELYRAHGADVRAPLA